jgi:hypothetical protein
MCIKNEHSLRSKAVKSSCNSLNCSWEEQEREQTRRTRVSVAYSRFGALVWGLGGVVVRTSAFHFTSEIVGLILAHGLMAKSQSPEHRGFSPL